MCKFISAWVIKPDAEGHCEIVCDPEHTDSHSDLAEAYDVPQNGVDAAAIEFYPEHESDYGKPDAYELHFDVLGFDRSCGWWTKEIGHDVERRMRKMVSDAIILNPRRIVLGGWWIALGTVTLPSVKCARIMLCGSSRAQLYGSSQATLCDSSRATLYHSSRATLYHSSRAKLYSSSRAELYESSQATLCDSSQAELYDSSRAELYDSSRAKLYHSSQAMLYESSQATLCDSSQAEVGKSFAGSFIDNR